MHKLRSHVRPDATSYALLLQSGMCSMKKGMFADYAFEGAATFSWIETETVSICVWL